MLKPTVSQPHTEAGEGAAAPSVSSRDLLGEGRELIIQHGRERYRLLLTKSNKLILTK
jgi:hemin uptake protein HemP